MKLNFYISLFLIFLFSFGKAGNEIDSIKAVFENSASLAEKFDNGYRLVRYLSSQRKSEAKEYYERCEEIGSQLDDPDVPIRTELMKALVFYNDNDNKKAEKYFASVIEKLENSDLKSELSEAYTFQGLNSLSIGNYIGSIGSLEKANVLCKELGDDIQVCQNNLYLGRNYENMGNNLKALEYYQKGLSLAKELKKERLETEASLYIGALYSDGINRPLGMDYLTKAAAVAERLNDTTILINAYTYIANSYYYSEEYTSALKMYEKIKEYCKNYGSRNTYAGTLGNMGNVYSDMGDVEKAMELQLEAVRIFDEIGDKQGLTICYSALGVDYMNMKQYDKALEYFNKSLPMAQEMQSLEDLIEIHENLARLYEETHDYEKAYLNYKLYKKFNDSVYNTSNSQKLAELELGYQFANKQKEQELLQALADERSQQRFQRIVFLAVGGTLVLLIIIVLVVRSNRQRKRVNDQLTSSNNAMRSQKEELETHKKEITDSINYAKRIQESILPPDSYWKSCLPESFIFYRPKDIVSGDFYWIEQKGDTVCFSAVDCTGHGVPGALMSVVGFNLLTQAVNEMNLLVPSEILKHLDEGVTKTLRQSGDGKGVKDGMDLSLCSLNLKTRELQYAGAYNSLYYVSGGTLKEVKSDKFPIGVNIDGKVDNYTNHVIPLQKGDCVYLFSDGYADQFGGPKGKKFKYNQLKSLLESNHQLPINEQYQRIADAFDSWMGELEQVDDVVIIGVRVI